MQTDTQVKLALRDRYTIERELGSGGMATLCTSSDRMGLDPVPSSNTDQRDWKNTDCRQD